MNQSLAFLGRPPLDTSRIKSTTAKAEMANNKKFAMGERV
jgi:hypothetical protein